MRVGIVGSGVTGLSLAHHLHRHGIDFLIFEKETQVGGTVESRRDGQWVFEDGPQLLLETEEVGRLIDRLNLRGDIIAADCDVSPSIYTDGQLHNLPTNPQSFTGSDLLSFRGKVRLLTEPFRRSVQPTESVSEALRRKFGEEAAEQIFEPVIAGAYAGDPSKMRAKHLRSLGEVEDKWGDFLSAGLLRWLRGGAGIVSFRDGLGRLPEALAEPFEDDILFDTDVKSVECGQKNRILTETSRHEVDEVVLTTSPVEAAEIVDEACAETAVALRSLSFNSAAIVHLEADSSPEGIGHVVPHNSELATRSVVYHSSLFDRGLQTAIVSLESWQGDEDLDEIAEVAADEFQSVTGTPAQSIGNATKVRYPAFDRTWDRLANVSPPPGVRVETGSIGRFDISSRISRTRKLATELSEVQSGERTLEEVSSPFPSGEKNRTFEFLRRD